ncbi:fungal chitosanase of glycosyl hydrolase group 75-domain-containing protein [Mycena rosella]|uniref:Endo-chitosanase n=1 Tax=Mycena rosella TaxID=1033263 RepID=A0AAD7CHS6_MYCRO|nr:fungal chitosanase of glycosyl hydrolase group 75-domain-containing protein [Mycena rosella]
MKFSSYCTVSSLLATSRHFALALPASLKTSDVASPPPTMAATAVATFAADQSINVAGLYAAAHASSRKSIASYPTNSNRKIVTNIYGDWQNLTGVSAFHFIADMDTDCDGTKSNCKGNRDGQTETSFGALDATKVPYFVLPERFTQQNKAILKDNALGAIICNGKMFYGIYGDQDADSPQVIGEASILMGQTCFPGTLIDGDNGHPETTLPISSLDPRSLRDSKNTIDIPALKALGDAQVKLLQKALGL